MPIKNCCKARAAAPPVALSHFERTGTKIEGLRGSQRCFEIHNILDLGVGRRNSLRVPGGRVEGLMSQV